MSVPVCVRPAGLRPHLSAAVEAGGGRLVAPDEARMLVWSDPHDADGLRSLLAGAPQIEVVQLLWAGVEEFAALGLFADGRTWACGKGVYADPVAEHALALLLALLRDVPARVRATSWEPQSGQLLIGADVTILGGGGIARSLIELLRPFRCTITVVRRRPEPMDGVTHVRPPEEAAAAMAEADAVVLALALTPDTRAVVDADVLAGMRSNAVLVNVARGEHVDTDALVAALERGGIAGAGLDVTDPEPLPDGHPLWAGGRNVIITPHTANTEAMAVPLVSERVRRNVGRLDRGEPLIGLVDPDLGY